MQIEITLPELGEGVDSGDILNVLVSVGDEIEKDQSILELETGKATVDVPAPAAGKITELKVDSGDKVSVGQVVAMLERKEGTQALERGSQPGDENGEPVDPDDEPDSGDKELAETVAETPKKQKGEERTSASSSRRMPTARYPRVARGDAPEPRRPATDLTTVKPLPAAPHVRKFARDLGLDLAQVHGTGPAGRISLDDVKAYSRALSQGKVDDPSGGRRGGAPMLSGLPETPPLPDFSKWGEIDREKMSAVRRTTAKHIHNAWVQIPAVTQNDKADITELEQFRGRYAKRVEQAGGKLTTTAVIIKVVADLLRHHFPQFNASVDAENEELIFKHYVNVGVAVDTPRGLLVPVIRNAAEKTLTEISVELGDASKRARDGKIKPQDLEGGTFSVTNIGGIGGTFFTPIINWPEVAILGVARAVTEPVWTGEEFEARQMVPFSLTYDHRIIDGADCARFLRRLCETLENPLLMVL
jgi:pyruvate dehydrogenase E2 component (dihydrolipoamide acetyltransferase)